MDLFSELRKARARIVNMDIEGATAVLEAAIEKMSSDGQIFSESDSVRIELEDLQKLIGAAESGLAAGITLLRGTLNDAAPAYVYDRDGSLTDRNLPKNDVARF